MLTNQLFHFKILRSHGQSLDTRRDQNHGEQKTTQNHNGDVLHSERLKFHNVAVFVVAVVAGIDVVVVAVVLVVIIVVVVVVVAVVAEEDVLSKGFECDNETKKNERKNRKSLQVRD